MWRGVLVKQAILVSTSALLFLTLRGESSAVAAVFGGCAAIANVQLLLWRKARAERSRGLGAQASLRAVYASGLERLVLIVVLMAVGMGMLELEPMALLAGFVVGQVAVVFVWIEQRHPG